MALAGWKTERMMRWYAVEMDQMLRATAKVVSGSEPGALRPGAADGSRGTGPPPIKVLAVLIEEVPGRGRQIR
jgi:hypothetical protein